MSRAEAILEYWFGTLDDAGLPEAGVDKRWFSPDPGVDAEIRARFEGDLRNAASGRVRWWEGQARGSLALVILFDQFPRNMYRGTPRAFLFDAHARAVAHRAIEQGQEADLWPVERAFLYMPFEHAETLADQDEAVARFSALADEVPADQRDRFRGFLRHAEQHREVIERFGRFPHRNEILGRESTPEEAEYLAEGNQSWGQARTEST